MRKKIIIKRFDPESVEDFYLQAYNIDIAPNATVLDVLLKIKEEHDGSLTFRRSCGSAVCGSCAVTVNGVAILACHTQLSTINWGEKDIHIEPLGNMPVIKDLVVNFHPFWNEIEKTMPWIEPKEEGERENVVLQEEAQLIDESSNCIMCGSCFGDCTIRETDDNFMGPAALAKGWRFAGDIRDALTEERLELLSEDGNMWDCTRCNLCIDRCPKEVRPMDQIIKLREEAVKAGIIDNKGVRHIMAFKADIKNHGKLNETTMPLKTVGVLRALGMIPMALRMQMKGKVPFPILKDIEGIEDVKKIYKIMGVDE